MDTTNIADSFIFYLPNEIMVFINYLLANYNMAAVTAITYFLYQLTLLTRTKWFAGRMPAIEEEKVICWNALPMYLFLWFVGQIQNFLSMIIQSVQNVMLATSNLTSDF